MGPVCPCAAAVPVSSLCVVSRECRGRRGAAVLRNADACLLAQEHCVTENIVQLCHTRGLSSCRELKVLVSEPSSSAPLQPSSQVAHQRQRQEAESG